MGPRSVERGKVQKQRGMATVERASMGPRSVERGKLLATVPGPTIILLQWGRVLLNAERTRQTYLHHAD